MMIDVDDGRKRMRIVLAGSWVWKQTIAIPGRLTKLRLHEHTFLLDIPKETLEGRSFDKDNWPAADREWLSDTHFTDTSHTGKKGRGADRNTGR